MFQILKQVIALFVLCVLLKQSFTFYPPFWIGVQKHMENKHRCIEYSLGCPPGSILCLCISFTSLSLIYNISNPHMPTLECVNPIETEPQSPQHVAMT